MVNVDVWSHDFRIALRGFAVKNKRSIEAAQGWFTENFSPERMASLEATEVERISKTVRKIASRAKKQSKQKDAIEGKAKTPSKQIAETIGKPKKRAKRITGSVGFRLLKATSSLSDKAESWFDFTAQSRRFMSFQILWIHLQLTDPDQPAIKQGGWMEPSSAWAEGTSINDRRLWGKTVEGLNQHWAGHVVRACEELNFNLDPHAPYKRPEWFDNEYGIEAEMLRAAWRRGNMRREAVKPNVKRYKYSVPDAREIWPDLDIQISSD